MMYVLCLKSATDEEVIGEFMGNWGTDETNSRFTRGASENLSYMEEKKDKIDQDVLHFGDSRWTGLCEIRQISLKIQK